MVYHRVKIDLDTKYLHLISIEEKKTRSSIYYYQNYGPHDTSNNFKITLITLLTRNRMN